MGCHPLGILSPGHPATGIDQILGRNVRPAVDAINRLPAAVWLGHDTVRHARNANAAPRCVGEVHLLRAKVVQHLIDLQNAATEITDRRCR